MKTSEEKECPRCGNYFLPQPTNLKTLPYSRFCETCGLRNLFDGLDLPTPPYLLDVFTKNPTLTEEEYDKKLPIGKKKS